jgi:PAS domain S-box-containing protein
MEMGHSPRDQELQRILFEEAADGMYIVDSHWRYITVNPKYCEMTVYVCQELLGMTHFDIVRPEDLARDPLPMDDLRLGRTVTKERHLLRKDGGGLSVEIRARMLPTGNILGIVRDISERRAAEDAIAREKAFSDDIISSLPGIFYVYDEKGMLVRWNRKHEEVTGYSSEELLGMHVLDFFSAEYKKYIASSILTIFSEGNAFAEAPVLSKGGDQIPYFFTGRLAILDGRKYFLGVGIDMTERRRTEDEKEKLQAQLLQAQKMESVGRLAGGVAHDFNNMLSAILGHAELAMMRCAPSEPVHKSLRMIEASAHRSAALVRQLLAFARKQTVVPKVLAVNDTVTGMLNMLSRLIGEDINLAWVPGAGLWPIKMDPSQIDQLLANLCVNARDSIAGVGKVTIETMNITFDEAYCAVHPGFICGEYVMLAVSDDGCGMSKEIHAHIFEPFFTTKEPGKGTGLGLATVYGIVKQNMGFVNFYSEPGEGSIFKIFLPRFVGEAVEQVAESIMETPMGHGETVLLVEDEAVILEVSREMLTRLGYRVLTALTPTEALLQARTNAAEIQLLFTDVVMPEMNGRDLAKLISAIKPGLKCLFTSGYTSNVIIHHGTLDEGVFFLQKPFSVNDLAIKVRQVLEGKEED